ncbi:3'-5' exoribonuclease [Herbaspirillum sp. C7C8]|uniref:3'-5' exoribonuclease n=1 Tax=Herbaspirillum sp. C7C8 TaxID=2736665 RepID=UPI001F51D3AC|nr:3'-5' exoribonuclease [Herbaspirillum sp. C7C8]MCI1006844.1 3'-5' exoribonuclease [Herbaspirillum sp. C7C8]
MKVFLDTEFTDFIKPQLISIGLVAESGEEFYAEIPFLLDECSDFVREVVLPLLGRIPGAAVSKHEMTANLKSWLENISSDNNVLEICFDFQTDWDLFIGALDYSLPKQCQQKKIANKVDELACQEFLRIHNLPEHHALYDAQANQFGYREE